MKTKFINHDYSTYARRASYRLQGEGMARAANALSRIADALEAKEPLAWQPAGTIPIKELLRHES